MIANIPKPQSALNFFLNLILICLGCSQLFEVFHPSKGTVTLVNSQNASEVKLASHCQFLGAEHEYDS